MSVQNAITLITLRLGRIETLLQKFEANNIFEKLLDFNNNENTESIENNQNDLIINNILIKVDTLENNYSKENIDLTTKLTTLENCYNTEITDLTTKLTTLENCYNTEITDLTTKLTTLENCYNTGITDLTSKIISITENNTNLQSCLSNLNNDLVNIKNELYTATNNNVILTHELDKLTCQISNHILSNQAIQEKITEVPEVTEVTEITQVSELSEVTEVTEVTQVIETTENIVDEQKKTLDFSNIL